MVFNLTPRLFFILLAMLGFGAWAILFQQQQTAERNRILAELITESNEDKTSMGSVVYAAKDIPEGVELTKDDLVFRKEFISRIPAGAMTNPSKGIGGLAAYPIQCGTIVLQNAVRNPKFRRRADSRILDGYRALTFAADYDAGVAGLISSDSRVDIYCLTKKKAIPVLSDVNVIAVSTAPNETEPKSNSVTVLVTPEDAGKVLDVVASGRPYLTLRNEKDHTPVAIVDSIDLVNSRGQ